MPDPNGTAVVSKFSDIFEMEDYLLCLVPIAVIVQFDDYRGPSISQTNSSCVPICPITVTAQSEMV